MTTSPRQQLGFPALAFPQIHQATHFYEPPTFTSPELSARMENTIKTSKLHDFTVKIAKPSRNREALSLTNRHHNGISPIGGSVLQQPVVGGVHVKNGSLGPVSRRHINSTNQHPINPDVNDTMNSGRNSQRQHMHQTQSYMTSGSIFKANQRHVSVNEVTQMQQSTARDTNTNHFISTERYISGVGDNIKVKNQMHDVSTIGGGDAVSSIGGDLGQTTSQWLKEPSNMMAAAYQTQAFAGVGRLRDGGKKVSTAGSVAKSAAMRMSIEEGRPSIMSESVAGSNLMATRIPYRHTQGDHNMFASTREVFANGERDEISAYSLGQQTPMSPGARQQQTMDKIQYMSLKARGKLRPGQPTAKQFAEQLKKAQAMHTPDEFGKTSAFVHNNTAKPITAYRFNKFKDMHKMRGINLDQTRKAGLRDEGLAQKMKTKREVAAREKKEYDKDKSQAHKKNIHFRGQAIDLYSEEDKARMCQGLKPQLNRKQTDVVDIGQSSDTSSSESDENSKSRSKSKSRSNNQSNLSKENNTRLMKQLNSNIMEQSINDGNIRNGRRARMYDLYGGRRNKEEFMNKMQKEIESMPPEVNISDIVDQFYNRSQIKGQDVESFKLIFQRTLEQEKKRYFNLKSAKPKTADPVFHLTLDQQPTPMKRIAEERENQDEKPMKMFTLHKYNLNQLQEAYTAYKEVHESIVYSANQTNRYNKMMASVEVKIDEVKIVNEIRQNPLLENIASIIEDPLTHALIRMLITYEKYNYETEEAGIEQTMNPNTSDMALLDSDMFSVSNEPPFKEIELMKELVLEIGTAINERMKEGVATNTKKGSKAAPKKKSEPVSPKSDCNEDPRLDSLSGYALRKHVTQNSYTTIDRFVANHPEFKEIKDDAKKKVLERVQTYQKKQQIEQSSPMMPGTPATPAYSPGQTEPPSPCFDSPVAHLASPQMRGSRLNSTASRVDNNTSPLLEKQRQIFQPRRKSFTKRSKLVLQQFVQSTHFQDAFTELIETLDNHYKSRRDQNTRAAQHVNKHVFYRLAKESVTHNAAQNPNIDYMNNCYDEKVMPFPLFSKIRGNMLKLQGYHLNDGYCQALQKYLTQQKTQEALIEKLVLHGNSLADSSFASILSGLLKNSKLRHLHYSLNDLGHEGNAAILKMLQVPFPNQLKSLCLSNLKTIGKAETSFLPSNPAQTSIGTGRVETEGKIVAVEEYSDNLLSNKRNVVHELSRSICHTESLMMLVLTDMPMGLKAQQNIIIFTQTNPKIENFQIINCQMLPENLAMICFELETQQGLQSLSFRKNVIRDGDKTYEFCQSLLKLILSAPALMHLDVSGMYIGNQGIETIMIEGVSESKTLAAVHIQDNKVSHWSRLKIYATLTRQMKKDEDGELVVPDVVSVDQQQDDSLLVADDRINTAKSNTRKMESVMESATSFEDVTVFGAIGQKNTVDDQNRQDELNYKEAHGEHNLTNRRGQGVTLDQKLDKDEIGQEILLKNITEMIKANMPIISFPESQLIIDEELLKATKNDHQVGVQQENLKGGIAEEFRGTLYNRISHSPELYSDRVEREKYFAESKWLSISYHTGCWICNSSKIIDRVNKKNQQKYNGSQPSFILKQLPIRSDTEITLN